MIERALNEFVIEWAAPLPRPPQALSFPTPCAGREVTPPWMDHLSPRWHQEGLPLLTGGARGDTPHPPMPRMWVRTTARTTTTVRLSPPPGSSFGGG